MLLKYFVSYYFQEKFESVLRCRSQWLCLWVFLSSEGVNQLQVLWETSKENLLLKLWSSNVFPVVFFWKLAEALGQHLKSSL